jgi:thioredoxin reductase
MNRTESTRLAILGAGPIGLEAALAARQLSFEVQLFERGRVAEHMLKWGHIRLFSPFGTNSTSVGRAAIRNDNPHHEFPDDAACITGRQHVAAYLEPLAKTKLLRDCIHVETQVLAVGRQRLLKDDSPSAEKRAAQPFRLLLREKGKERVEEADILIDCTGVYGQHRWMGEGGIPAPGELAAENQLSYALEDVLGERRNAYAGKTTLVYGGGYSAATTVCNLAELAEKQPDTWVIWLARTAATQPLKRVLNDPLRERDRLAVRANTLATRADGNVEFHGQATIRSLESLGQDRGFRVSALVGKQMKTWDVDRVIGQVGYTPDTNLYRELQVHECYASLGPMKLAAALAGEEAGDCLQQTTYGADTLKNPEPNFYILGMKSYGRNPHFLMRVGFEQVREVIRLIGRSASER